MSSECVDIKQLEAKIKEDAKNANELPKIIEFLTSSDKTTALAAVQTLRRLFLYFAENGDLKVTEQTADSDPLSKYHKWLWGHYVAFLATIIDWLANNEESYQVAAMRTLMEIVSRQSTLKGLQQSDTFGNETYIRVVRQLLSKIELKGELLSVFKGEYVAAYVDVQYYTMKNITQILDSTPAPTSVLLKNCLLVMDWVMIPQSQSDLTTFLVKPSDSKNVSTDDDEYEIESECSEDEESTTENNKRKMDHAQKSSKKSRKDPTIFDIREHERRHAPYFTHDVYKTILAKLPNSVMPHLTDPLLLADFLTDSYNIGGITSLLALNSLFVLIQEYNFDYPDFFSKLYALLSDESLMRSKFRKRFFKLLTLFLSSTYLPAYVIAAFTKRSYQLSRLSLTAEPGAILFIIPCVYNLVLRHKECIQLIHRSTAMSVADKAAEKRELLTMKNKIDVAAARILKSSTHIELKEGADPFDNAENDPSKCNALKSSLWEIYTLKHHYHAGVATRVKIFEEKIRSQMLDLSPDMEHNYADLIDQSMKRREKQLVPLAFELCSSVFDSDDTVSHIFDF
ncbi:Aste57867_12538 [Aphanomyces stellatus]|uniref:Aste57867_12538 protein n=1 Tax=Aphanomyces stellatus TaxID=120398 RepID=A0A485KVV4_9STRA|nr:hypothetical protein As57867_012492 [Aphanomyces stellatus]VFT89389.1 Aste57867_12538 [Aphanomyces stellatus]